MKISVQTPDIVMAATLRVHGYSLSNITKDTPGKNHGTFIFEDVDEEFLQRYHLGQVMVEPQTFNDALRALTTTVKRMP